MTGTGKCAVALAVALGSGCAPALDWREFVPEGTELRVAFPCRPDRQARAVAIAGATLRMEMLACSAGGATYAVSFAGDVDPARIGATLAELRAAAVANVGGVAPDWAAWQIAGMTPSEQAGRLSVAGTLPDGAAVREHAAFFTRGRSVYQASVIGAAPAPSAVEAFLGGLKFPA